MNSINTSSFTQTLSPLYFNHRKLAQSTQTTQTLLYSQSSKKCFGYQMSSTQEYEEYRDKDSLEKPPTRLLKGAHGMTSLVEENHHFGNLKYRISLKSLNQSDIPQDQDNKSLGKDKNSLDQSPKSNLSKTVNKDASSEGKDRFFERLREFVASQQGAGLLEELCHQPRFLNAHHKVPLEIFERVANLDFSQLREREILELMTSNKHTSVCLQQLLAVVQVGSDSSPIISCVVNNLAFLIVNPYGNYVIQKLVVRNNTLLRLAEDFCIKHFAQLYDNEFASRLMQLLIEISPDFRTIAAYFFKENLQACVNGISAIFLATSILRSWNHVNQLDFVIYNLKYNLRESLQNKYMKRILVVFLDIAPDSMLETTFGLLRFETELLEHLNDKYLAFACYYFIRRGYQPAIRLLRDLISFKLCNLLVTKHFKYVMIRLLNNPLLKKGCLGSIIQDLQRYRVNIPPHLIRSSEYYLFVTIMLTACDDMGLNVALSVARKLKYFELLDPSYPSKHPHLLSINKILKGESRSRRSNYFIREYTTISKHTSGENMLRSHACEIHMLRNKITPIESQNKVSNTKEHDHHQGTSLDEARGENRMPEEDLAESYDV